LTRFALDTNAISYALSGKGDVRRRLSHTQKADVGLPTLCMFEVWRGARLKRWGGARLQVLTTFLTQYAELPFDSAAADHASDIAATLEQAGTPIGPLDTLIAGVARSRASILVTHNTREFSRVPGLMIEDWY